MRDMRDMHDLHDLNSKYFVGQKSGLKDRLFTFNFFDIYVRGSGAVSGPNAPESS